MVCLANPKVTKYPGFLSNDRLLFMAVFLAAILMRIPTLESWWCLDDWGQLAGTLGTTDSFDSMPARWFSQHLYWKISYPFFGLNAVFYSISRILLHAVAAMAVARIAKNSGMGATASLISGVLFAASPISFTALYWASGIQELLAGVFGLWAVERWFAKDRTTLLWPTVFGILSIISKESGLCLPILFLGSALWKKKNSGSFHKPEVISVFVLSVIATVESYLILEHFATGAQDPYGMGGLLVVLGNLGKFGWWLLTQGPVFTGQVTWTLAWVGIGFFALWIFGAIYSVRQKVILPMATVISAMLSLAPALVLVNQARPYMGYLAMACLALAAGCLWPTRWELQRGKIGLLLGTVIISAGIFWGFWGMDFRTSRMDGNGLPADPVVRAMALSHDSCSSLLRHFPGERKDDSLAIVIFQQPLRGEDILRAQRLGEKFITKTSRHAALSGELGLTVLAGNEGQAFWVNSLLGVPSGAYVFCETQAGFEFWGNTGDALLNAVLVDVFVGNYSRAQKQLQRAAEINCQFGNFEYDPQLLGLSLPVLHAHAALFLEKLYAGGSDALARGSSGASDYENFLILLGRLS